MTGTSCVLLTARATLVSGPGGSSGFEEVPFGASDRSRPAIEIEIPFPPGSAASFLRFLEGGDRAPAFVVPAGALAGWTVAGIPGGPFVTLARDGAGAPDPAAIAAGDRLLALPLSDRRLLAGLAENAWVLRSNLSVVPAGGVRVLPDFRLGIGTEIFELRHHLPFEGAALPYRVALFADGWRYDELCLLRPLVHVTAFGEQDWRQLGGFVRALLDRAGFDGHLLIVTERPRAAVLDMLDRVDTSRILVRTTAAPTGHTAGAQALMFRYATLDTPDLLRFQPILMLDTHVAAEGDLSALLASVCASDRICVPLEPEALRRAAPFVGLGLLQRDGVDTSRMNGIDPSIMAIPNVATHAHPLRLIRRLIANRIATTPPGQPEASLLPWLELETVNYVAATAHGFDTHLLAPHVDDDPGVTPEGGHQRARTLRRYRRDAAGREALAASARLGLRACPDPDARSSIVHETGLAEAPVGPRW